MSPCRSVQPHSRRKHSSSIYIRTVLAVRDRSMWQFFTTNIFIMRTFFFLVVSIMLFSCSDKQAQHAAAGLNPPVNTQLNTAQLNRKTVFVCGAITKSGTPCKRVVKQLGAHCFQHDTTASTAATVQCEGMTKKGERCKNKSKTAFCHLHNK